MSNHAQPSRLQASVDIASLALFRMAFGALMFWEVWRILDSDWIGRHLLRPRMLLGYPGFEWLRPWPGDGLYVHMLVLGVAALGVTLGLFYRLSAWLLCLTFWSWFLLDQTRYLNHLYLVGLLTVLMAIVPAHRAASLDAWRRPGLRRERVPAWCLWLLRGQLALVYLFAGIAKLNPDWLAGEPLRQWFAARADLPLIGPWVASEPAVWIGAYGGLLFDLLVVPALLWRRTRVAALIASLAFHTSNAVLFEIGIFPPLMLAATTLFLPADWPRRLHLFFAPAPRDDARHDAPSAWRQQVTATFLIAWFSVQVLAPLRHLAYPGSVHWTEEGHLFAWHMKLRSKRAEAHFFASDPATGEAWEVDPLDYLTPAQAEQVGEWPDLCVAFAHALADDLRSRGHDAVQIRVESMVSLNGRPPQLLIAPSLDLTQVSRGLAHADWILPLEQPLPGRAGR